MEYANHLMEISLAEENVFVFAAGKVIEIEAMKVSEPDDSKDASTVLEMVLINLTPYVKILKLYFPFFPLQKKNKTNKQTN